MRKNIIGWSLVAILLLTFTANTSWAEGLGLGETKEQLKLDYELKANVFPDDHVTVEFWLAGEGRLAPITGVDFLVPHKSGSGTAEFAASLSMKTVNGKQFTSLQMPKALAERAEIHLRTGHLDGKTEKATFYFHSIPLKNYLQQKKG